MTCRCRRAHRSLRRAYRAPGPDGHDRHLAYGAPTTAIGSTTSNGEIQAATVVIATGACNRRRCRRSRGALPPDVEQLTPFEYRNPAQLPDGGVLVVGASATGVQLAAEIRAVGTAGDPLGRRARAAAADVPRPRRPLVDGRLRRLGPALRRGRRSHARTAAPVAAARRDAGAATLDLNALTGDGRRAGRPFRRRPRRPRALLRRVAQRVLAGRPEAGAAAGCLRRVGRRRRDSENGAPSASPRPRCRDRPGWRSTCEAARSVRSSGRPDSGPTTRGSTCRSSTRRAGSATTAASSTARASMPLACPCCGGASRRSSTASRTMRAR